MSGTVLNWDYSGISVRYQPHLDGDGRSMADQFVQLIEQRYADRLPFETCYEWCSGPGFIGFALLAKNICRNLVLADINPEAVALARETVTQNQLQQRVRVYESDNLKQIPGHEKFDLVVSNPPNYYCLNPLHPSYTALAGDLRPNDPGWEIHKDFYRNIGRFLNPDAVLCIEEVDPYAVKCFMPNLHQEKPLWGPEPFDIRPRPPILDFRDMIAQAGLVFDTVVILPEENVPIHVLISHRPREDYQGNVRLRAGMVFLEQVGQLPNGDYRLLAMLGTEMMGYVDLPDERLWLVSIVELLLSRGDRGLPATEIAQILDLPLAHVTSAIEMMRGKSWI